MKADLTGGPLDGGTAEVAGLVRNGSVLIVSAYCSVAHRFIDHKYEASQTPKKGSQQFKWKGQKN